MSEICGWCIYPKEKHILRDWTFCQSKIRECNSSKDTSGGVQ